MYRLAGMKTPESPGEFCSNDFVRNFFGKQMGGQKKVLQKSFEQRKKKRISWFMKYTPEL